jgi:hypothetical protein
MRAFALATMLSFAGVASARPPIPPEQWDRSTHLWLARAFVAEAGWKARRDWAGIAWVLAGRWRRASKRWPALRFVSTIRGYCAGLGEGRSRTARMAWVHGLRPDMLAPGGWPAGASWERHEPWWRDAVRMAERWSRGGVGDPCRGRAQHWGGPDGLDPPRGRMERVDCGETLNVFYRLGGRR